LAQRHGSVADFVFFIYIQLSHRFAYSGDIEKWIVSEGPASSGLAQDEAAACSLSPLISLFLRHVFENTSLFPSDEP
jgi:hypothetical protein